jgi:uncharacterized protein YndB with AHSA1/START domain
MLTTECATVIVKHKFATDGGTIYAAILNPSIARKFLSATPTGKMAGAEIDARVGGKFALVDRSGSKEVVYRGEFLDITCPTRMIVTLLMPEYSSEPTTVRLDIAASGKGFEGSEVTLTQTGVPTEHAEQARKRWEAIMSKGEGLLLE